MTAVLLTGTPLTCRIAVAAGASRGIEAATAGRLTEPDTTGSGLAQARAEPGRPTPRSAP